MWFSPVLGTTSVCLVSVEANRIHEFKCYLSIMFHHCTCAQERRGGWALCLPLGANNGQPPRKNTKNRSKINMSFVSPALHHLTDQSLQVSFNISFCVRCMKICQHRQWFSEGFVHQHLSISGSQSASKRGSESQRSKCSKSKASKLFCLPLGAACENTEVMAAGKSNGEALGDFFCGCHTKQRFRPCKFWVSEPCSPPVLAVHRAPSAQVEARIRAPRLGSRSSFWINSYWLSTSQFSYKSYKSYKSCYFIIW